MSSVLRFSRLAVIVATGLLLFSPKHAHSAERPNIVLVMADDLGWGDPRCFNPDSPISTPHIDVMAGAGLKFNRFYAAAPVCSPTRGSCLTGRHPYRYGIYSANVGHMKSEEITLPEMLSKAGYATGHFGKWHLETLTTEVKDANRGGPRGKAHYAPPRLHGYERCFVTESKVPTFDPIIAPPNAPRTAWDFLKDRSKRATYNTRYWDENGNVVGENLNGDDSKIIMDRAVPFIESAVEKKQPFFAVVWFHAPHLPVVAGPDHVAPYARYDVYKRNYYGCVSALDEQVGRLRSKLQELEIADNTMLWFCSDNGPEGQAGKAPGSAGHLKGRKRSLYEGGVRVPGILEWPGHVKAGRETNFAAVTSDYLPTVLDVLDVEYPDGRPVDGVSLLPLIEGRAGKRDTPIGFQSKNQLAWTTQTDKIYSGDRGKSWELYDLSTDAGEEKNLASLNPDRVKQLARDFRAWQASCKASDEGSDYPRK
jgi:arylsulfatase A-like enzyme